MGTEATPTCPNCQRLQAQLDTLHAQLESQHAQLETLKVTVGQLQQQLAAARKDSSTSSKPPSSDIVKPPKPPPPQGQDRRHIGGQPGHPKHERALVPPELVNGGTHDHFLELCPACGQGLQPVAAAPRVVQQSDVPAVPVVIEAHCSHPGWCPLCQAVRYAPFPVAIERGGLVGPRLTALIAYLKGACHASFSTIRKFLRDVAQVAISRGQLAKVIAKVSRALEGPYRELLEDLPIQARLNIDETGHKQNGDRMWTWCFRAGLYTLFKIDPTRSGDVLIEVLGTEFNGVLGCERLSHKGNKRGSSDVERG